MTTSGFWRGRPRLPATGRASRSSSNGISWVTSLRLPPVSATASGIPVASTNRWCFEPVRERSTGDGPVRSPQKGTHMRSVDGGTRPIDRARRVQPGEQLLMQRVPHTGLLPVAQPPPRRDPGAVAVLLRQVLPRDPRVQHVQDPVEDQPVGDRLAPRVAPPPRTDRDQRFDLGPQLVIDLEPGRHLHDPRSSTTPPTEFEVKES